LKNDDDKEKEISSKIPDGNSLESMRKALYAKTAFCRKIWQKQHASSLPSEKNLFKLFSCIVVMFKLL
jgi:hypothetical protein